jgi:hypothetical protein
MGGLDRRWMLSPANPNEIQAPIRSLTISTPRLGSPTADVIDHPESMSPFPHLPFEFDQRPVATGFGRTRDFAQRPARLDDANW